MDQIRVEVSKNCTFGMGVAIFPDTIKSCPPFQGSIMDIEKQINESTNSMPVSKVDRIYWFAEIGERWHRIVKGDPWQLLVGAKRIKMVIEI